MGPPLPLAGRPEQGKFKTRKIRRRLAPPWGMADACGVDVVEITWRMFADWTTPEQIVMAGTYAGLLPS